MRLLLDTSVALWEISGDSRVPAPVRSQISDPENSVFISAVTLWEIAIKFARRRGRPNDMPISADEAEAEFRAAGYLFLDVTIRHALAVAMLPLLHSDPFDRMLIAQARSEPLRLVTSDRLVASYGGEVLKI